MALKILSDFKLNMQSDRLFKLSVITLTLQILVSISLFLNIVLALAALQLGGKLTVDTSLSGVVNNSDRVAIVESINADMYNFDDRVTKIMIEYFIENAFSVFFEHAETLRRISRGGELYYLSSPAVWDKMFKLLQPTLNEINSELLFFTIHPQVSGVKNITGNLWEAKVDLRRYNMMDDTLSTSSYVMNIKVAYFPGRVKMKNSFRNPLGFTVIEFNQSNVYKGR